jgi:hypothetical protein
MRVYELLIGGVYLKFTSDILLNCKYIRTQVRIYQSYTPGGFEL